MVIMCKWQWATFPVILSIFGLVLVGFDQEAFAVTVESNGSGGGIWTAAATWSGGVVPSSSDDVIIKSGDLVEITSPAITGVTGSISIEAGAELKLTGASSARDRRTERRVRTGGLMDGGSSTS